MERVWTDRDELNRLTAEFNDVENELRGIINSINIIAPSTRIGNIGLRSGNKIRSFYKRFKENNVNYTESIVNRAIETYLLDQCDSAFYSLARYAYRFKYGLIGRDKIKAMRNFTLNSKDIEDYQTACEKVFDFDLDRDIIDAINFMLDNTTILIGITMNDYINECNNELESLGIKEKVAFREEHELDDELLLIQSLTEMAKRIANQEYVELEKEEEKQKIKNRNEKK